MANLLQDITRLNGMQLVSVVIATNIIRMNFIKYPIKPDNCCTDSASIDIEEGFTITKSGSSQSVRQADGLIQLRLAAMRLVELIEHSVTKAETSTGDEALISFESGEALVLHKSTVGFDSYAIHFGGSSS